MTPLTFRQIQKLRHLVGGSESSFMKAALAFKQVRDEKLHRIDNKTFDEFCREHGLSEPEVNELIMVHDQLSSLNS